MTRPNSLSYHRFRDEFALPGRELSSVGAGLATLPSILPRSCLKGTENPTCIIPHSVIDPVSRLWNCWS